MSSWPEALLMSTHNIVLHAEIRKILSGFPLISGDEECIHYQGRKLCQNCFCFSFP